MRGDDVVARAAAALLAHLSDSVEEEQAERVALAQRKRNLQARARARARSAVPQVEHCPDLVVLNDIDEPSDPETPERPGLADCCVELRRVLQRLRSANAWVTLNPRGRAQSEPRSLRRHRMPNYNSNRIKATNKETP